MDQKPLITKAIELIESGPDHRNAHGESLLTIASYTNDIQTVKYLIEHGADPNLANGDRNNTPLHRAVDNFHIDIVEYLLGHGADPNVVNAYGHTSLHRAVYPKASIPIIKMLLDCGVDKYHVDNGGVDASKKAREWNNDEAAQFIESYDPVPTKGVNCG